jgi:hypothetical protein
MAYSEEDLWEMSDKDLQKAFKEAKAQDLSPETDYEEDAVADDEEVDLEQPDEDSDYETSSDEEVEVDTEEDTEEVEGELDGEPEAEEVDAEVKTEADEDEQPVQRRKYKANGKDYEFTDQEIFEQFGRVFGQAMDYTKKSQQLKPWRKTIDAIEQAGLSQDDVNLAIDVLSGDKEAIAALLKRTGVDALELDTDNVNYTSKDYGRNDTELAIKDIVEEISGDKEYAITYDVLERQWDAKSKEAFVERPELIRELHLDVKSGMFDTLMPIVNKMRVYDGGKHSDLDYYGMAAKQYYNEQAQAEARLNVQEARRTRTEQEQGTRAKIDQVKADEQKRVATKTASTKRKAAAPTGKAAGTKKAVDYLDASDEAFEEFYKRIQDSY